MEVEYQAMVLLPLEVYSVIFMISNVGAWFSIWNFLEDWLVYPKCVFDRESLNYKTHFDIE